MPAPPRPTGPISPADLLWRHELKEHNATLLCRMNALEARFEDQERRVQKAEEAATTCTGMAGELDLLKNDIEQLETKQQEFISTVHKRLVDMDKDMGEFRKTQERVQKLMSSYREMDGSVEELSLLSPRVEDVEREVQGLKNNVGRKHIHEMENLDTRLEALELQRLREETRIRAMQEEFAMKCKGEIQGLRTEMGKLMEARRAAEAREPYMQVPRSPDMRPSTTVATLAASHQRDHRSLPKPTQQIHRENETQGTTQTSTQGKEIEDLDLNTNFVPSMPLLHRKLPPPGMSPRKKPKLSHPKAQAKTQGKTPQHQKAQPSTASSLVPKPALSKIVKLSINLNKKRPGSPVSAPRSMKERPAISAPQQQTNQGSTNPSKSREKKSQPSQPARRSRRRSAHVTVYELGWNHTQQPQTTAGPVYDTSLKLLKTKPRRLPPVPDE